MNEKEIITALEHCSSDEPCKECPRLNEVHCMTNLMGDALELIKSNQKRMDMIVEQLESQCSKTVYIGKRTGKTLNLGFNLGILKAIDIAKGVQNE